MGGCRGGGPSPSPPRTEQAAPPQLQVRDTRRDTREETKNRHEPQQQQQQQQLGVWPAVLSSDVIFTPAAATAAAATAAAAPALLLLLLLILLPPPPLLLLLLLTRQRELLQVLVHRVALVVAVVLPMPSYADDALPPHADGTRRRPLHTPLEL